MALTASASFRSFVQPRFLRTCLIFHHIPFSFSMFRISSCCVCLSHGSSLPPYLLRPTFFRYLPFPTLLLPPQYIPGFCGSPSAVFLLYLACHTFFGFLPFPFFPFSSQCTLPRFVCVSFLIVLSSSFAFHSVRASTFGPSVLTLFLLPNFYIYPLLSSILLSCSNI